MTGLMRTSSYGPFSNRKEHSRAEFTCRHRNILPDFFLLYTSCMLKLGNCLPASSESHPSIAQNADEAKTQHVLLKHRLFLSYTATVTHNINVM